jgi:FixJ family two-component response regulator
VNQKQTSHAGSSPPAVRSYVAVVDDEVIVRRALERLLRASGFRVGTFPSAEVFLAGLVANRPDCLVLDIHLGRMSGLELQASLSGKGERIPCVMITAHDDPLTRERCLRAGVAAYLTKPFDDWQLIDAIKQALNSLSIK